MPRTLEYKRKGYTLIQLKDLYYELGSYSALADYTGISSRTLMKYIGKRQEGSSLRHTSELAEWIRKHPFKKLPKSPMAISILTGISIGAVKMYLHRRREKEYTDISLLAEKLIKNNRLIWLDSRVKIPTEGIRKWTIEKKNTFSHPIPVTLFMKGGSIHTAMLDPILKLFL